MQVQSLGPEDPLEEKMATHSSILAWAIPWTEEPGSYSPWDCKDSDTTEWLSLQFKYIYIYIYSKNFEVHDRKTVIFLEETPGRNMYVKADSSENLERSEKIYRENFYRLTKYIYHYE